MDLYLTSTAVQPAVDCVTLCIWKRRLHTVCNNSSNKKESIFLVTDIDKKITTEMKIDNKQQDLKC
jgi:hypothetical protein